MQSAKQINEEYGAIRLSFHRVEVGGLFHDGFGVDFNHMIFEKISKSKAKVVEVYGYPERHLKGVHAFSPFSPVWQVEE